jgi:hypothetical protein
MSNNEYHIFYKQVRLFLNENKCFFYLLLPFSQSLTFAIAPFFAIAHFFAIAPLFAIASLFAFFYK